MSLPQPEPGLVICYAYLWRDEQRKGFEEGRKDRPCIVVAVARAAEGAVRVVVLPVTRSRPSRVGSAIELPPPTKTRLGLDDSPSWVIVDEANHFHWPGFDIRPIPGGRGRYHYGFVGPRFFEQVRSAFRKQVTSQRSGLIRRD